MSDTLVILTLAVVAVLLGRITLPNHTRRVTEDRDAYEAKLSVQRGGKEMIELHKLKQLLKYVMPIIILGFLLILALVIMHK